jgi:DNA-directed RNA polymerase specialized sigma24 family protein
MRSRTVESLLAEHRATLVVFVERRLGSRAAAEDVVQQASVRALGHAAQLRDTGAGRAWLFQITRRLVADRLREKAVQNVGNESDVLLSGGGDPEFGCACVIANLHRLPDADAGLLRRAIIDGASATELAKELGVSTNATTVRLSRARAALREQLRRHCGTESLRECIDCACNTRGCCSTEARTP